MRHEPLRAALDKTSDDKSLSDMPPTAMLGVILVAVKTDRQPLLPAILA